MSAFGGGVARTGSSLEADADDHDQDGAGHELRDRRRGDAEEDDRPIGRPVATPRGIQPAAMARGTVMAARGRPAWPTGPWRPASCGRTGWSLTYEFPKSSVTTPLMRVEVLDDEGPVRPEPLVERVDALLRVRTGPRIVRPTSLGSTFAITKTIVTSSQIVMSERSSRRAMNRAIGYLSPGLRWGRRRPVGPSTGLTWCDVRRPSRPPRRTSGRARWRTAAR